MIANRSWLGISSAICLKESDTPQRMLTEMTPTQQRLHHIFGLDRYAPAR